MTEHIFEFEDDPLWYKDAIIYELHVKSFCDSTGDGIGDFKGLISKLDYLKNLGITAIWLLPFYPSPLKDDGYDISDYLGIHPLYGTLKDFKEFLKQAHKRGLRVITELVLNHTSDQHPWFQKSRNAEKDSKWRNYYVWSDTPEKYQDARIIFKDFESSNWSWDPVAKAYYWHRFYSHQPDLNYNNPEVQKMMYYIIDFWLEMGVDGLRLDAVPYLFERDGTNCENLPETHDFLKKLRSHIDSKYKNKMLLAEANQWSEDAIKYFGNGDECHMAFNFPIMPRLFMAIQLEDRFPITDILESSETIPDTVQWAMFLRNHDELTLEMVTDEERDSMYRFYAADPKAKINLGIRRRLAPLLWNNPRKIEIMNILLFSLSGTPVIYYGDEIGMGDNYYLGDRDGVRTPMQWSPLRNAGFSSANPQRLYLPVIIDPEYHFENINVENQEQNLSSKLWWTRRVIAMRKQFKAFGRGKTVLLQTQNAKAVAFIREYEDEKILVVINLSRFSQAVIIDLSAYSGYTPQEVFSRNDFPKISGKPYFFTLGPYNYFWFLLNKEHDDKNINENIQYPVISLKNNNINLSNEQLIIKLENKILETYLKKCRWFAGKGRKIRKITIIENAVIPKSHSKASIMIAEVFYSEGESEKYIIPVLMTSGENEKKVKTNYSQFVIAMIQTGTNEEIIYDGICSRNFQNAILSTILHKSRLKGMKGQFTAFSSKTLKQLLNDKQMPLHSNLIGLEQSNSSIVYDETLLLKLFRKIDVGRNPDAEIIKTLSEHTEFKHLPVYTGIIEYTDQNRNHYSISILENYIKCEGDSWQFVLDHAVKFFERLLEKKHELSAIKIKPLVFSQNINADQFEPSLDENFLRNLTGEFFANMISLLGKRTGEMHNALSSITTIPDFAPEPFSLLYQRSIIQSMKNSVNSCFRLLDKNLSLLKEPYYEQAKNLLGLKDKIIETMNRINKKKIHVMKTRIHGDYHLGQILFTGNDFYIIDFEGEPLRPLSERRLKRSPLRDIAGMIRSFHYAIHSALLKHIPVRDEDIDFLNPWTEVWFDYVKKLFLDSYRETVKGQAFFPAEAEDFNILLDAFILDKAVYEIIYEINHRPDWIVIPIKGITAILKD